MNLTLFFRLMIMAIFANKSLKSIFGTSISYDNTTFHCPAIFAKDGFFISLQINHNNYCESENGYRVMGHTWETVEFGFPSEDDVLLHEYCEDYGEEPISAIGTVGNIPVSVLETLFERRGGIDWDKTLSIERYNQFLRF